MARKQRFTKALPVYVTPAMREEVDGIAEQWEISLAETIRVLIELGLQVATPQTWRAVAPQD